MDQSASNAQRRPARRPDHQAFLGLQTVADQLMGEVADLLKPFGLSPAQYNVLRILRGHARKEGAAAGTGGRGLACHEIGRDLIKRDPDITRLLDRMELRGLIARTREAKDRRVITTRITPAGLAILAELDRPIMDLHERQLGFLGSQKLARLLDLLEQIQSRVAGSDGFAEEAGEAHPESLSPQTQRS